MKNTIIPTFEDKKIWRKGTKPRALVMMSGGVDSSAAAVLLRSEGYDIAGLTMSVSDDNTACESAASVCRALEIPHFSINISNEFKERVKEPFCRAYTLGMTPNPCADCNERVKFGLLWEIAEEEWGTDFITATGHYARITDFEGSAALRRGANLRKDQSYFLCGIKRERLARISFPLGEFLTKDETRDIVRKEGLPVAERPESMEICFAGESNYRYLIGAEEAPGNIFSDSGIKLGTHKGISNYTLGQRKGLGIAAKEPLFVTEIHPKDNIIVVSKRDKAFSKTVYASRLNLLLPEAKRLKEISLFGKIRSQGEPAPCRVISLDNSSVEIEFAEPVFAPASGQRLVLYTENGIVAAGAVIVK